MNTYAQATEASSPLAETSAFGGIGFVLLILYLFLIHSRILEYTLPTARIALVLSILALCCALLTGRLVRSLTTPVGICLIGFTIWLFLSTPFSVWRGGSVQTLIAWLRSLTLFVLVASLVVTLEQFRKAAYTIAGGTVVLAMLALTIGSTSTGRLFLPGGRYSNPNDLAVVLILSLPLWWLIFKTHGWFHAKGILALGATIPTIAALSLTGSRGAMLTVAGLIVIVFLTVPYQDKVRLAVGVAIILILSSIALPGVLLDRLTTLSFERPGEFETGQSERAFYSMHARWEHLRTSAALTLQNPLLGVGPGQFMVAEAKMASEESRRALWRVTHNTFTEASSEAGIPALFFYVAAIVIILRSTFRHFRALRDFTDAESRALSHAALAMFLSLAAFALLAMVVSLTYQHIFPLLAGLAVSLDAILKRRYSLPDPQTAVTTPTALPAAGPLPVRSGPLPPVGPWRRR